MSRKSMKKLSQMLQEATAEPEMEISSISDQKKTLADYLQLNKPGRFKVGDFVTQNSIGKTKYKFPIDGQVARIVEIFDTPKKEEDLDFVAGTIAITALSPKGNCIARYNVDLAFYEVIEEPNDASDSSE
jgi:hypothetical protein